MASEVPLSDLVTIEDHLHNDRVNAVQIADFCYSHHLGSLVWPGSLTDLVATTKTRSDLVQWCYPELIERYQHILTQLKDLRTVPTETLHSWLDATGSSANGPLRKSAPAVLIHTIREQLRLLDNRKPPSGESPKIGARRRDTTQCKSGRLEHSGTMAKAVRGSPGVCCSAVSAGVIRWGCW